MSDPTWQIKLFGTRGSTPVCENGVQLHGGNTTCIYADLLTNDRSKGCIVFDAGTGIRRLGKELSDGTLPDVDSIFILLTHFHWDHIQGLPFFGPIYNPSQRICVFAPHEDMSDTRLQEIFELQMQEEYFPVQLDNAGAKFEFITLEKQTTSLLADGGVRLTYRLHNHPGGAFSYRLEANGKVIVICTDLEHGETIDEATVAFCRGADLLIHDAQYTDGELAEHRGWGHSSYSQAIEVAKRAGVAQLIFTHHDPDHDDDFLARTEKECQQIFSNCRMARDGMEILV
ncbi:MBL fold metallo-hydrolase [Neolewinella antarctica]|uniref:Phosphoribosyl 1,2-cyclic phosphodiesterase n=1 Tax=Neolewinella antarctica TaxID=442734 RepID=A0ABX0X9G1_9BACT|nr:MBL fold metallo-hydrolase [Neolewinella antarctica]NJC25898.1 phosphoribosyl 1,2-cyclic phosphodiesterase [Neolewinella antarctica]